MSAIMPPAVLPRGSYGPPIQDSFRIGRYAESGGAP
jgi:hypothetical protein